MPVIYSYTRKNRYSTMSDISSTVSTIATDAKKDANDLFDLLVEVGANPNVAKMLLCLHTHGKSSSIELQERCGIRQPEVSLSINQLKEMGLIDVEYTNNRGRGRPSHNYCLNVPLSQALIPFKEFAKQKLTILEEQVARLSRLTEQVSS